ncbi:hypothetical protein JIG36_42025 [Actinoplanes sp. LDG1-06]|uniref:Uncharacterized protein n=1 Tax=Paractinoplanes ovalisporus TaxID=2810368 RepID=A0ABS2AQF8_9ACTN|nr:hypothetical protein [Actinoplanes ovalisporus]MBM2622102.1 hypothetical protein [Actinoplanes ovalisporus]
MILPPGATSFAPHTLDLRAFKTACHRAARAFQGRVESIVPPGAASSFAVAKFAFPVRRVAVLHHAVLPWATVREAAAEPDEHVDAPGSGTDDTGSGSRKPAHWAALTQRRSDLGALLSDDRPEEWPALDGDALEEWGAAFDGLRVLTPAELDTDITRADLTSLGRDELTQVRYWQPATVGELLFNRWD